MSTARPALIPLFLVLASMPVLPAEFEPLFNGRNLDGWEHKGDGVYEVVDGIIAARTGKGGMGWLATTKEFGDFVLELDVKCESGNSGIQVRSHFKPNGQMFGYQIEIDPKPRAWSGGLYEQGRRGWLQSLAGNEPARQSFKVGEWNRFRIECIGDSIRTWVNDVPAADYVDSMDLAGRIGLQVHSGQDCQVSFRNIRIRDLGRHAWKPLWDGRTLDGWYKIGKGRWEIVDGVLVGKNVGTEVEFGHLVTDADFDDFTVRLKYKALEGNSGLYFRIEEKGFSGVSGFQAEIDPLKDAGGLYETNGRAWVSQPKPEDVKKWYRPGEWNTMTVTARGRRLVVDVNGFRTAEVLDDPGRLRGKLALQLHGGQDVQVMFKEIEMLVPKGVGN